MEENTGKKYRISSDASWRNIGGDTFVLMSRGGMMHRLDGSAVIIWRCLTEGQWDQASIARCICDEYEVPYDKALSDVADFMEILISKGIIGEIGH